VTSLSDHLFPAATFSLTNGWLPKAGFTVTRNAGVMVNNFFSISKVKNVRFLQLFVLIGNRLIIGQCLMSGSLITLIAYIRHHSGMNAKLLLFLNAKEIIAGITIQYNIGSRPSDHYFRSVCLSVCLFVCAEFVSAVFDPI